jgi:hypothetical protein
MNTLCALHLPTPPPPPPSNPSSAVATSPQASPACNALTAVQNKSGTALRRATLALNKNHGKISLFCQIPASSGAFFLSAFSFQHFSSTQTPLFPRNPHFPALQSTPPMTAANWPRGRDAKENAKEEEAPRTSVTSTLIERRLYIENMVRFFQRECEGSSFALVRRVLRQGGSLVGAAGTRT